MEHTGSNHFKRPVAVLYCQKSCVRIALSHRKYIIWIFSWNFIQWCKIMISSLSSHIIYIYIWPWPFIWPWLSYCLLSVWISYRNSWKYFCQTLREQLIFYFNLSYMTLNSLIFILHLSQISDKIFMKKRKKFNRVMFLALTFHEPLTPYSLFCL